MTSSVEKNNANSSLTKVSRHSLSVRLLRIVFSIYLIITILITGIQMFNEYMLEKNAIKDNLISYQEIFYEGIGAAMWNFDLDQLQAMMDGVETLTDVAGLKIEDTQEKEIINIGVDLPDETDKSSVLQQGLFYHSFDIIYANKNIGKATFYSSDAIVFDKVKYNFLTIIGNAILKTIILWILFIWAFNKYLVRALESFISKIEQYDLSNKTVEEVKLDAIGAQELSRLERVFNDMLYRVNFSKTTLEDEVNERTKRLTEQQQMLEQMSQQGRIGAWEVDLTNQKVFWSKVTREIHEVDADYEPQLATAIEFYKEGEDRTIISNIVERAMTNGENWNVELRIITAKGNEIWVAATGQAVIENGQCVRLYGSFQDIDERIRFQKELEAAKETAESAAKMKSEFLATMSHEIRTPMNGVLGMLALLENTPLTEDQKKFTELANQSGKTLLALINDILDFSKIDAGQLELESIKIDIGELLGQFSHSMAHKAQEKNLEFILDISQVQYRYLYGDSNRLLQILTNLVGNALKFTHEGDISLTASTQYLSDREVLFECRVSDTGIGIPEDKQISIFNSFTQVDASTTRRFGGTGLGLSIAKQLCELMGGNIQLQSAQDQGSTFVIQVRMGIQEQSLLLPTPDNLATEVIVIEENAKSRSALDRTLNRWGVPFISFANLEELIAYSSEQETKPSQKSLLVLASYRQVQNGLPDLNHSLSLIGGDSEKTLIALLKVSDIPRLESSEKQKFNDLIAKPVLIDDLIKAYKIANRNAIQCIENESAPTAKTQDGEITWPPHTRILLVEDAKINQVVAQAFLDQLKLEHDVAEHGLEALEKLQAAAECPYSLIIMDCQMPVMDGYEATRQIRSGKAGDSYKDITIVALTANALQGDEEKCLKAGMDDYLTKPIDLVQLTATLSKHLLG